jgi:SHS2 domain-containing protein
MPYEELPHTADWCLRVDAPDLAGLLVEAALGMNELAGITLQTGPRVQRTIALTEGDAESLLVAFLSEILFLAEQKRLAFNAFRVQIDTLHGQPLMLRARLRGRPIRSQAKAIKAVTFHNLNIHTTSRGLQVEIVFDV